MKRVLRFGRNAFLSLALPTGLFGQSAGTHKALFPIDKKCVCVKTKKQMDDLISYEFRSGKAIYQVFKSRTTGREVFRVGIGEDKARYWNYGLVEGADFNGDGVEDFSWYGGDDTSDEMFVFLSSRSGYRKLDIYATLARYWVHRFHKSAPDFAALDSKFRVNEIALIGNRDGLWLAATVGPETASTQAKQISFKVPQSEFVYC